MLSSENNNHIEIKNEVSSTLSYGIRKSVMRKSVIPKKIYHGVRQTKYFLCGNKSLSYK